MNTQTQTNNILNLQTLSQSIFDQKESFKLFAQNSSTVGQEQTIIEILQSVPSRTKAVVVKKASGLSNKWTIAQTELFFKLLAVYSTDFDLISKFLVSKTRTQIKRKFKSLQNTQKAKMDEIFNSAPCQADEQLMTRMRQILAQN